MKNSPLYAATAERVDRTWTAGSFVQVPASGIVEVRGAALMGPQIDSLPDTDRQGMFWQFPCRTEGAAFDSHAALPGAWYDGDAVHLYVGLPWATWIDLSHKQKWTPAGRAMMQDTLWRLGVQIAATRRALAERGTSLRVHTVCQHIEWAAWTEAWFSLGITDLWLSHCPHRALSPSSIGMVTLHAWPLFAVNVEDLARREGLVMGRPTDQRRLLASFIGAHMTHYLDDSRLRLAALPPRPDLLIKVTAEWHFEHVVYRQQIEGLSPPAPGPDAAIAEYNRVLSDSVFALCPAGAGLNTLRLWEALAVGAIPVLFDHGPRLPDEGASTGIDWETIVVRMPREGIAGLTDVLAQISAEERRRRQESGWRAYECVKRMLCIGAALC